MIIETGVEKTKRVSYFAMLFTDAEITKQNAGEQGRI
jgi:hypothetical protein